jgi:hypothetical protein
MSYLDLARQLRGSEGEDTAQRLDLPDCVTLIRETFEAVATEYLDGALALLDTDPDLCRRFHDTEAAVKAGPTEHELRVALAAHVAVIREACQRRRAQREAAADTMPELPDDATAAVGFTYATGGAWVSVRRG